MDTRVSLEVFFIKTNEICQPTSHKFTCELIATDPCLRFLINMTYAEKRAWTGFWNILFVY